MSAPNEAALAWIRKSLALEIPDLDETALNETADVLHAIALNWNVPIEALVLWIHSEASIDGIGGEFRRWCQRYHAERAADRKFFGPEHWPE
jgi:hypothetical protein